MSKNSEYKKKYLKYKIKYLQLAGNYTENENILDAEKCIENINGEFETFEDCENFTKWKNLYRELHRNLLCICKFQSISSDGIIDLEKLCIKLFSQLKESYDKITDTYKKRLINYNMRFIVNCLTIIINELDDKIVEFNKSFPLDEKNFYYMEDAFTNNLDLFYDEYAKLIQTKKSIFFYKSNLVNISILFKCFSTNCIEKIISTTYFYVQIKGRLTDDFEEIFTNFNLIKYKLIELLLIAFADFAYENVKKLYIEYLNFYYENFRNLVQGGIINLNNLLIYIIDILNFSGDNYFLYLSCNLPSEIKFQKFEATKILISYIGNRENSDNFYNSIVIIEHDIKSIHNQFAKKLSYTNLEMDELQEFYKKLFDYYKGNPDILNNILIKIHNEFYECVNPIKFTVKDILDKQKDTLTVDFKKVLFLIKNQIMRYSDNNKFFIRSKNFIEDIMNMFKKTKYIEQCKLLKYLENEIDNKNDFLIIKKFILDPSYVITFSNNLTPDEINLFRKILKKKFNSDNLKYTYELLDFLKNNYPNLIVEDVFMKI